ncbi:MAG TPA: alpha/beta hydrolase [Terriglobales bacterium]|nr:alpha/beta hydrolase [Terriglobales bacterium]
MGFADSGGVKLYVEDTGSGYLLVFVHELAADHRISGRHLSGVAKRRAPQHSAQGSALTMRNYQAKRSSLSNFKSQFSNLTTPTLLIVGDEDDPCIETTVFKRTIPSARLWVAPRTGHAVNLEEPAAFNREVHDFFSLVERGRRTLRDPRSFSS